MPRRISGRVALVGAGPGDPGLLTIRGREVLTEADVVVYDALVSPEILALAPKRARRIAAESAGPHGGKRQRGINRILIEEARRGRYVVRLKGGDPFVFGRGYEELEALDEHGVLREVVPGVTSAIAGPAAAGIPVTYRGLASTVTIATGHEARGHHAVPWERIAKVGGTLVALMCTDRVDDIARRLIRGGRSPQTPVAIISRASLADQEIRRGTLGTLSDTIRARRVSKPSLLVVGDVAALGSPKRHPFRAPTPRTRRRSV